jgi:hypothetical protein
MPPRKKALSSNRKILQRGDIALGGRCDVDVQEASEADDFPVNAQGKRIKKQGPHA